MLIILGPENIERIKKQDPFEIRCWELPWAEPLGLITVSYLEEEQLKHVERLAREGKTDEATQIATAGFQFRPDLGDHDRGFERL